MKKPIYWNPKSTFATNGRELSVRLKSTWVKVYKKRKIDASTIEIGVARREEVDVPTVRLGKVDFYDDSKGFGFIKDSRSIEKYFFHINNAYPAITEGHKVTYELERGDRGMNAVKVTQLK